MTKQSEDSALVALVGCDSALVWRPTTITAQRLIPMIAVLALRPVTRNARIRNSLSLSRKCFTNEGGMRRFPAVDFSLGATLVPPCPISVSRREPNVALAPCSLDAGGGTRTPDTRIMIPLL